MGEEEGGGEATRRSAMRISCGCRKQRELHAGKTIDHQSRWVTSDDVR